MGKQREVKNGNCLPLLFLRRQNTVLQGGSKAKPAAFGKSLSSQRIANSFSAAGFVGGLTKPTDPRKQLLDKASQIGKRHLVATEFRP